MAGGGLQMRPMNYYVRGLILKALFLLSQKQEVLILLTDWIAHFASSFSNRQNVRFAAASW